MKTLYAPERCQVLLEPDEFGGAWVSAVKFRGATWRTQATLEVWVYWGEWWLDPRLEGEARTYFVLGTGRGEITVFCRVHSDQKLRGWFVSGWYD